MTNGMSQVNTLEWLGMQRALQFYYEDDLQAVAMGCLESVFDRPAAKMLGHSPEQVEIDLAYLTGDTNGNSVVG